MTQVLPETDIPDERLETLKSLYLPILETLGHRDKAIGIQKEHLRAEQDAGAKIKALGTNMESGKGGLDIQDMDALDSKELEALIAQAIALEELVQQESGERDSLASERARRELEIPLEIVVAKQKISDAESTPIPDGDMDPAGSKRAKQQLKDAKISHQMHTLLGLEAELAAYKKLSELYEIQEEYQKFQLEALTGQLGELREAHAEALRRQTAEEIRRDKEELAHLRQGFWKGFPELAALAEENLRYDAEHAQLNETLAGAEKDLTRSETLTKRIETDYSAVKERVKAFEAANLRFNQSIGHMLRKHRLILKGVKNHFYRDHVGEASDAYMKELEHRDAHQALLDIEGKVAELLDGIRKTGRLEDGEDMAKVAKEARKILRLQREHHAALMEANHSLAKILTRLNSFSNETERVRAEFNAYIDERILWVQSSPPINMEVLQEEYNSLQTLFDKENWEFAEDFVSWETLANAPIFLSCLIALGLLIAMQPRIRKGLSNATEVATSRTNGSLRPTLMALACTMMAIAPLPMAMWTLGQITGLEDLDSGFAAAVSEALLHAAVLTFIASVFRHAVRKGGLGIAHFHWPETACARAYRHLNWYEPLAVALVLLASFLESQVYPTGEARGSYVALMLATAIFNGILLLPRKTVQQTTPMGKVWRKFRFLIFVCLPLALAACSLAGYHYTAMQLVWHGLASVALYLVVLLTNSLVERWFYLARKRIAQAKWEVRKTEEAQDGEERMDQYCEKEIDHITPAEIKEHTKGLLRVFTLVAMASGLWVIWADITPALNILDRHVLWHVEVNAETVEAQMGKTKGKNIRANLLQGAGETTEKTSQEEGQRKVLKPITPSNIALAIALLIIMGVIARDLPCLLELVILKHLRMQVGSAYAVTAIVQYVVIVVGIVMASSTIGLSWEKVQWLAAAVTLGIGFGLQEIFANFVSGIILLFERPIRVGDVITIEKTIGVVSKIRIRATTITNLERQELVIPNKNLITESFTNWTLSDPVNRLTVPVGVARDSDTTKVTEILTEIACNNPHLLDNPKPKVAFDLFGDDCLNFTIRGMVNGFEDRIKAVHSLHMEINQRFYDEGIEIRFPLTDHPPELVTMGFWSPGLR